jgi:YesN/AraC family two-component response regulator
MDDFLTKPIERALLSNLIERLRGQRTEANASGTQDARGTAG